jgi:hypothetical protein
MTKVIRRVFRLMEQQKGKHAFVERDMPGEENMMSQEIEAMIPFVVAGVADENTWNGSRGEFVRDDGCGVWKAKASKNPKVRVGRLRA